MVVRSDGPDPTEQVPEQVPEEVPEPEADRKEASNVGAPSGALVDRSRRLWATFPSMTTRMPGRRPRVRLRRSQRLSRRRRGPWWVWG